MSREACAPVAQAAQSRAWQEQNPEAFRENIRRYHQSEKGQRALRAAHARYMADPVNREKQRARVRAYGRRRRAERKAAAVALVVGLFMVLAQGLSN